MSVVRSKVTDELQLLRDLSAATGVATIRAHRRAGSRAPRGYRQAVSTSTSPRIGPGWRQPIGRAGLCLLLIAAITAGQAGAAGAIPPPPVNPSDEQISNSQSQAAQISAAVGELSAQAAATQGEIDLLNDEMALKAELAQKAAVDLDLAEADAADAAAAAVTAGAAAQGAQTSIDDAQVKADGFAAASFRQGSQLGSVSALFGSGSIDELLQRQQLLDAVSGSQLDVIGELQRARVGKVNLEAAARAAFAYAQTQKAAADQAKTDADAAQAAAALAFELGQARLITLQDQLFEQQIAYQAANTTVIQLQGQRQAYNDWLVLKAAEEERLRKEAEEAARKAAEEEAARQAAAAEAARVAAEQAAAAAAAQAEADRQAAAVVAAAAAAAEREATRTAKAAATKPNASATPNQNPAKPAPSSAPTPPKPAVPYNGDVGATVIAAGKQWIGTTYAWGGGNASGPTRGIRDGGTADTFGDYNKIGFDCSGLTLYAYAQAGIALPHYSGYQYNIGSRIAKSDLQPGDLMYWARNTSDPETIHHVAIYLGNDQILEARQSGTNVMISPVRWNGYIGATRPGS